MLPFANGAPRWKSEAAKTSCHDPQAFSRARFGDDVRRLVVRNPYRGVVVKQLVIDVAEWTRRLNQDGSPPTPDDQSKTWDGRVLNSKEAVLAFLEEVDAARREGRALGP